MAYLAPSRPLGVMFTLYWALFWLLNGLDKFCYRENFNLFFWYGSDRHEKFDMYFERLGLSAEWVPSILAFAGIWQLLIAVPLFIALFGMVMRRGNTVAAADEMLSFGLALGILTFIVFSVFAVVAGDRTELWEHGTYVTLTGVAYVVAHAEVFVAQLRGEAGSLQHGEWVAAKPRPTRKQEPIRLYR